MPKDHKRSRSASGPRDIRLNKLLDVLDGPDYEVTYPNGDRVAYVTAVYEAEVVGERVPRVTDSELSDVAWFSPSDLAQLTFESLVPGIAQS